MCGRFFLSRSGAEIARHFGLAETPELQARYNVAPGQEIPFVRALPSAAGLAPPRILERRRWGFVPAWAKDPRVGSRHVNARAETAPRLPMFRAALARRRGLVPADGFYEWLQRGRSSRPFAVRVRGGALFAMAAVFERWEGPDGALETCAILTTDANAPVTAVHDRMPVILPPEHYEHWLDPAPRDPEGLASLLVPCPGEWMELHPVGRRVNDPREDDAGLLEPDRDPLFAARGDP